MAAKLFEHKIVYRVILTLIVPLLWPIICFALQYQLTVRTEANWEKQRQLTQYNSIIERESLTVVNSIGAYIDYLLTGDELNAVSSRTKMAQARLLLAEAVPLSKGDERLGGQLVQVRAVLDELVTQMQNMPVLNVGDENSFQTFQVLAKARKRLRVMMHVLSGMEQRFGAIVEENQDYLVQERAQREAETNDLKRLTIAFLTLYTFVAVGAVWWLTRGITRRLSILVDNAYRLPHGVEFAQQVSGNDELSYLDKVLHDANKYLREAREQRGLVMEMVAHDMRSPLMAAQIALELLTQGLPPGQPDTERQTGALRRNLSVVINLVEDLLTIDRLEAGALELDKKNTFLRPLIDDAIDGVNALAAAKNISLVNECEADLKATADHDRIVQVLTNLISNAIKFSPKGSTISVVSGDLKRYVQLCVVDQGPGLPPGMENKVFEKFQQVEKEHAKRGYGLGLTICKMLVELHGGTIKAQNAPEIGSAFCFTLPAAKSSR